MARQYVVPGVGNVDDTGSRQYVAPSSIWNIGSNISETTPVDIPLSGSIESKTSITASLVATNILSGNVVIQSQITPHFSFKYPIFGSIESKTSISGSVIFHIPLFGNTKLQIQITPDLTFFNALAGNISIQLKTTLNKIEGTPQEKEFTDLDPLWVVVEIDLYNARTQLTET